MRLAYKFVNKYLSTDELADDFDSSYLFSGSTSQISNDLLTTFSQRVTFTLMKNNLSVSRNNFIDLSKIPFTSSIEDSTPLYSSNYLSQSLYRDLGTDPEYGYFSMTLIQDNMIKSTVEFNEAFD